jgi:uncharacterized protein YxeA
MKAIVTIIAALLVLGATQANEVFVTRDAQGRPVYTDRPDSLPAQKMNIATKATDTVEVQRRYDQQMTSYAEAGKAGAERAKQAADAKKATELTAEDRARRCQDARKRYEGYMNARRLYEPGATEGERRYLEANEIDAARENAKKLMDEFCAGQ